jgi:hypothetical protein
MLSPSSLSSDDDDDSIDLRRLLIVWGCGGCDGEGYDGTGMR